VIAALVYPHQLFVEGSLKGRETGFSAPSWIKEITSVFIVEDPLFFRQYRFHRQKLLLHRASMKSYADQLMRLGKKVVYIDAKRLEHSGDIASVVAEQRFGRGKVSGLRVIDPEDHNLLLRLRAGCRRIGLELEIVEDPNFLTSRDAIDAFAEGKKKLFFTNFYIEQRKRLEILIDTKQKPMGGKWSFDTENRKRLAAGVVPPSIGFENSQMHGLIAAGLDAQEDGSREEAVKYVEKEFPTAYGERTALWYPSTHQGAQTHLLRFIQERLSLFGDYEDAIAKEHPFIFHSVLTPMLNVGLVSPRDVVDEVLGMADRMSGRKGEIPLNSLEGFIRQVIGWREYMRLVYRKFGTQQRTRNYWDHSRRLPASFYDGTTGIEPVDHAIRTVLRYGYCHHIERLMILGNFMLLCEFHPDAIYQWFMEMFVDAYDWVMVPNVYGMSQHSDGGMITTKPYISGSSYVLKMSDFKKGAWTTVWDGLYWSFVAKHRGFFEQNPRMKVMASQIDRMGDKLKVHQRAADAFLQTL
jgi:deoxyribodipyrimidine photolyase-related protein